MTNPRHFLDVFDLSAEESLALLHRARELKLQQQQGISQRPLTGKILGMIFEKASTRTRVSFEVGMIQLGGHAIFLSTRDSQLGRGETIEDTAKVLSRMVDAVMIRTFAHQTVQRFAAASQVPVINGLTDYSHPCQLLADIQTIIENCGGIKGRTVAWIGDGNNMCNTYVMAARQFDFHLRIAVPEGYEPDAALLASSQSHVALLHDPIEAVHSADVVTTDVWASMGQEGEQAKREQAFALFQVNADLMRHANPDAIFLHCLPAHRGEEVSADVIDGPHSRVWDQAENRLHAQKALLEFLLLGHWA